MFNNLLEGEESLPLPPQTKCYVRIDLCCLGPALRPVVLLFWQVNNKVRKQMFVAVYCSYVWCPKFDGWSLMSAMSNKIRYFRVHFISVSVLPHLGCFHSHLTGGGVLSFLLRRKSLFTFGLKVFQLTFGDLCDVEGVAVKYNRSLDKCFDAFDF